MDTSFLLGARGVQLPQPFDMAQQALTIGNLANARQLQQMQLQALQRKDAGDTAFQQALPLLLSGGDVADLAGRFPAAGEDLLKTDMLRKKNDAEIKDKEASRRKHEVDFKVKAMEQIANVAYAEAQNPTPQSLSKVGAYARHYGVDLPPPPQDPQQLSGYLKTLGDAAYSITERVKNEEQRRYHDIVDTNADADREQRRIEAENRDATARRGQNLVFQRAGEANKIAEGGITKQTVANEEKLHDDWRQASKGFMEVSAAIRKVNAALDTAHKNPGSALAAGTAFMKILDPTSVVRESELALALNASGWFDRATVVAQRLNSGGIMTPKQVSNLRAAAADLYREAQAAQRQIDAHFQARAQRYGLSPDAVIMRLGQDDDEGTVRRGRVTITREQ